MLKTLWWIVPAAALVGCTVYNPPKPEVTAAPPAQTAQMQQTCREYQRSVTLDGKPQTVIGSACLQQDGTWREGP